jgi:hypothetical protein
VRKLHPWAQASLFLSASDELTTRGESRVLKGYDFSRADKANKMKLGFSPCGFLFLIDPERRMCLRR